MGKKIKSLRKLNFLIWIYEIWYGYSKEPSQWDGPLQPPKHMFKLMGKKLIKSLRK